MSLKIGLRDGQALFGAERPIELMARIETVDWDEAFVVESTDLGHIQLAFSMLPETIMSRKCGVADVFDGDTPAKRALIVSDASGGGTPEHPQLIIDLMFWDDPSAPIFVGPHRMRKLVASYVFLARIRREITNHPDSEVVRKMINRESDLIGNTIEVARSMADRRFSPCN